MPPLNVTIDGSVVVGPAERKFPPAMVPAGMSAKGWSAVRMLPPTIDAFTEPVRVQGVPAVQGAGEAGSEGRQEGRTPRHRPKNR